MKIPVLILFVLLSLHLFGQQGLLFKAEIDTQEILIGDHIHLRFDWTSPVPIEKIQIQTERWDSTSKAEWVGEQPLIHQERSGMHFYEKEFTFTFFDSGAFQLPPLPVQWEREEQTEFGEASAFTIKVRYPEVDSSGLAPIKPIEDEPLQWSDFDQYVYGSLILLALLAGFLYWRRQQPDKEVLPVAEPDPNEQAFIKLQALEQKQYIEQGHYESFQVELTHIMREFLFKRYRIKALESTSREILYAMKQTDFPPYKLPILQELLTIADLVKFAKAETESDFHKRMLLEAREIVKLTAL
jgi:hypothetical protein